VTSETSVASTDTVFLIATVTGANGVTPTGAVEFSAGSSVLGSVALVGSAGTATATLPVSGSQLASGATIAATYSGSSASVGISVSSSGSGSGSKPSIADNGIGNAASYYKQAFAPGELIAIFGAQLAGTTQPDTALPLPATMSGIAATINGEVAPLLYVSPGQVNLQIPYEVPVGTSATVTLNNNGQVASQSITIAAAAPGIFTANGLVVAVDNNTVVSSAKSGDIISIFITGAGAVSPSIATGAAPSSQTTALPNPAQTTSVTVGNATASTQFIGIPPGLVGVVQINFVVPNGLALGSQPVVVTVGGVASAPAMLTITN
jgi:uncharacterized protein (TIGR03437 family)